ncbi:MAG: NUDIX domain-containing protein [Alphaproteobacteria bacterium]|jgi:8-oxo-dGTP pyrophosphatase MutT (NUDIX family)|nr:NUDIX domain-containing protein [Alphaproteobacteria bacterium]
MSWSNRPLNPNSKRYKLACFLSSLITGHRIQHMNQWGGFNAATINVLVHNGKVLMGKRASFLDRAGQYSLMGGYIEPDIVESFAEGAAREIIEECHIAIDPDDLILLAQGKAPKIYHRVKTKYHAETHNIIAVFVYVLTDDEAAMAAPSNEMDPLVWLSISDVVAYAKESKLAFKEDLLILKKAHAAGYF